MSKFPVGVDPARMTAAARKVLLDGVDALGAHCDAVTVVGAQAVHLRTVGRTVCGPLFTPDADLVVDPLLLGETPRVEDSLRDRGFTLRKADVPGSWQRPEVCGGMVVQVALDLLLPGRTVRRCGPTGGIGPWHGGMYARRADGLEAAAVDRSPMAVGSLDPTDSRRITVNVAGPTALLLAKAFKISDRLDEVGTRPERLHDKDAGDVVRLMMATTPEEVDRTCAAVRGDSRAGGAMVEGLKRLRRLFGSPRSPGVDLAVSALDGWVTEERIRTLTPRFLAGCPD
ncbi:hypothetical protein ACGFYF_40515 [Streptomyces lavendulae]|uniref:hypothetical protein n=1 Tax=Streptomyces lavendulae TaxID=1914 RepID=UPI0037182034